MLAGGKPCHRTHHGGNAIDLRYMDKNGNPIKAGNSSYELADAERMKRLIQIFSINGYTAVYTGQQSKCGLKPIGAKTATLHKNHIHFGNNRPSTLR